jgi:SAM-dependent methyltransferase
LFLICFSLSAEDQSPSSQEVFSKIYETKYWGSLNGEGYSGSGSLCEQTVEYRQFLQQFLAQHKIVSVVDVGCGDWTFSQAIDWSGIDYHGFDVVESVIEKNKLRFGSPSIHFAVADGSESDLIPPADLLLCKDVLQHLPFQDIEKFLKNIDKYKYCLITNDVDPNERVIQNRDVPRGDHRYLDLTQPPFSIDAEVVLTYRPCPTLVQSAKQVLLIKSPMKRKIE